MQQALKLDNTMLMYGIYNAGTLEELINTVQEIHNVTSSHERLFAGEHNPAIFRLLYMDALGIQQYAFNSLLFLRVVQDKYVSLYKELITQLKSYVSAIRILAKGYLPTTLIMPSKLQEILAEVMLCNAKWIDVRIVMKQKKTVIHSIYFPASSHLVYCLLFITM